VILSAQLAAEKLPVNFLLFTGSLIFALSLVVLAKRAGRPASGAILARRTRRRRAACS
jgi:hypothetical protein